MRRRTLIVGLGSSTATAIGITALGTDTAKANQLSVDGLDIPDEDYQSTGPISKARLTVNGRYQWETSVVPDDAILRLELKKAGSWEQLEAKRLDGQLSSTQEDSYEIRGNLFDHSRINPVDLSPQNVGESKSVEFNVRVKLTVRNDGRDLETLEATDTGSVTVNKSKAEVTGSIGGSGSFEISE